MKIYEPEEDTFLLSKILEKKLIKLIKKNPNIILLEIGSGSGFNLETAFNKGIKKENIFCCDINPEAIKHCKKLGFNCIKSNLFENFKNKKFDIIIFNPPYLPEDKREPEESKLATTSGEHGSDIINIFLQKAKIHLKENGKIFLITSSLTKKINWQKHTRKKVGNKKLFFEELYCWELLAKN